MVVGRWNNSNDQWLMAEQTTNYKRMKKILTLCVAILMAATTVKAQHEIGGVVGGMNGLSYKYWMSDNLALQADLAVGLTCAYAGAYYKGTKFGEGSSSQYDFTINPNALYHFDLSSDFKLYAGGGINFGLVSGINNTNPYGIMGKFGINGVFGASYDIANAPVVLAFDFRPGYGLGFEDASSPHMSFFDWKLGFAVRYKL